jgi:hypothetical protein
MREWKPPIPIPVGALLVPREGKEYHLLPRSRTPIYLGWDTAKGGMRILFPDGIVSTHDPEEILAIFEEVH